MDMKKKKRRRGYTLFELVVAMAVAAALLTVAGTAVLSVVNENRRANEGYELAEELSELSDCLKEWTNKTELLGGEKTVETFADGNMVGFRVISSGTTVGKFCFDKEEKTLETDEVLLTFRLINDVEFAVYDDMLKVVAHYGEGGRVVFLSAKREGV